MHDVLVMPWRAATGRHAYSRARADSHVKTAAAVGSSPAVHSDGSAVTGRSYGKQSAAARCTRAVWVPVGWHGLTVWPEALAHRGWGHYLAPAPVVGMASMQLCFTLQRACCHRRHRVQAAATHPDPDANTAQCGGGQPKRGPPRGLLPPLSCGCSARGWFAWSSQKPRSRIDFAVLCSMCVEEPPKKAASGGVYE